MVFNSGFKCLIKDENRGSLTNFTVLGKSWKRKGEKVNGNKMAQKSKNVSQEENHLKE